MPRSRHPQPSRSPRRTIAAIAIVLMGLGGAIWGVTALLGRHDLLPSDQYCEATANDLTYRLAVDQTENAAMMAQIAERRDLPPRAVTIALATALQESKLRNIDYGDRDSLGLFQQRPSQGWGTEEQVMDPIYATKKFYSELVKVPDYENLPVTEAAQAVQRSAFPDAYAQHEDLARAFASALTGHSPAGLTCVLRDPEEGFADPNALIKTLRKQRGKDKTQAEVLPPADDDGPSVVLLTAADERGAWGLAAWAVAHASAAEVVRVEVAGQAWVRATESWGELPYETVGSKDHVVRIVLLS